MVRCFSCQARVITVLFHHLNAASQTRKHLPISGQVFASIHVVTVLMLTAFLLLHLVCLSINHQTDET